VFQTAGNRRSALGALMGLVSGVAWGSVLGLVHPTIQRISPAARSAGLGMAVMGGNDVPAIAVRDTKPTEWGLSGWISDLTPHMIYGIATVASYERIASSGSD
jgi:hypothetical protein